MEGETKTKERQEHQENIELQRLNEEEEIQDRFDRNDRDRGLETDLDGTHETDFGGRRVWQEPLNPDEFLRIRDEKKEKYLSEILKLAVRRDDAPDFVLKGGFVSRKNSNIMQRIEYNGKEIYYIERGEVKGYTNNRNRIEREDFDRQQETLKSSVEEANL